ncbi:zinc finger protein 37-like [Ambystoma mexicanum]|uniref:zinc finger protein 37-like n=1 Tax=Ambystoma mexicanum TaxID=8296 RepID=UPI0037E83E0E
MDSEETMENSTEVLHPPVKDDDASEAPVLYIQLRHPSRVLPRVRRSVLARLVMVRPDPSRTVRLSTPALLHKKQTEPLHTVTSPAHEHVGKERSSVSPLKKKIGKVKGAGSPLNRKFGKMKSAGSPLKKKVKNVKSTVSSLKVTQRKSGVSPLKKKFNKMKSSASPLNKKANQVKSRGTPIKREKAASASGETIEQCSSSASSSPRKQTGEDAQSPWKQIDSVPGMRESARPRERRHLLDKSCQSEEGEWAVVLIRLDIKTLNKYKRKYKQFTDKPQPLKKVKKEVRWNSEEGLTQKKLNKTKMETSTTENQWHHTAESKKHVKKVDPSTERWSTEAGEKTYPCTECGIIFRQNATLIKHRQIHREMNVHTNSKQHENVQCSGNLSSNSKLHKSLKKSKYSNDKESSPEKKTKLQGKHLGNKLHTCNDCEKCFHSLSMLVLHQKVHAREKMPTCNVCRKTFSKPSLLIIHRRIHTGYFACNECGKSFSALSNLKVHQMKHKGTKSYACNECGKSFKIPSYLQLHQRIHTLEKWRDKRLSGTKKGNRKKSNYRKNILKEY